MTVAPSTLRVRPRRRPVVLCILDGWGWRTDPDHNAVLLARTPVWDSLLERCPFGLLQTSGRDVGLPAGQMGNSEVGHMNIGAGRIVEQDLPRIDAAVADGSLAENQQLLAFAEKLKASGGTCHLLGLLSPGGVHSHQDHMAALARALDARGIPVAVHALLDGRDTPPQAAPEYVERFLLDIADLQRTRLATVCGRYFAMDRDKRWERVARAYEMLVASAPDGAPDDPVAAIRVAHQAGVTDEFVEPVALEGHHGIADGDGVLVANFRADRVRQLLAALLDPDFDGFARGRVPALAAVAGMVEYSPWLAERMITLFPPIELSDTLGEVVAEHGGRQLRIAETEKYPHVTYFLNGGAESELPGEERILVPSPKVATYDLQPEMSAPEVTDRLVEAIESDRFDLIVINYANGDMVGHTGSLPAAIQAAETVDACLGRLVEAIERVEGCMLVTADHGNCEQMWDASTDGPHTAHTTHPVPALLVNGPADVQSLAPPDDTAAGPARLADLAPTVLALLGLPQPEAMSGRSLLHGATALRAAV